MCEVKKIEIYSKNVFEKCDFLLIKSVLLVCSLYIDRLQGGCDLVLVLSGNQLLLDPGGGSVPAQPHLHDLLLRQKVSVGIHSDRMG